MMEVISTVGLMKTIKEDMSIQKRLKHSGLKRKRLRKTKVIFLNRFGQPQHQSTLNKAIRRIIRDCNDEQFLKTENPEVLLPHFSCHSLRHTFTTRMCEAGVNIKVIQDTLGHKDITTTLNIYTDVTKELKRTEFDGLDKYFNNSIA